MRECGSCGMCCKVLPISSTELNKEGNKWCTHWSSKSKCTIYDTRPTVCRDFLCAWLVNEKLPEALRPDKCGAVLSFNKEGDLIVTVDKSKINAWREGILGTLILKFPGKTIVYTGNVKICEISPEGGVKDGCIAIS